MLKALGARVTPAHRKVMFNLSRCRTSALGGEVRLCRQCGDSHTTYASCRDRHCPKCSAGKCVKWLKEREKDLLEVAYYHVVFTLPDEVNPLALGNKGAIYSVLFKAVSETLLEVARDRRHLGADIGFFAVLHTWGQTLQLHPHLHCVVPACGFDVDTGDPVRLRSDYLMPVKVLSAVVRGKFLDGLQAAHRKGQLRLREDMGPLDDLVRKLRGKAFVSYVKRPFASPLHVLRYVARYTHRVAITNHRMVALNNGEVTLRYKDYAARGAARTMTLSAVEFLRRFLMHTVPSTFHRVRHFGFLANRVRREKLPLLRAKLAPPTPLPPMAALEELTRELAAPASCPTCGGTGFTVRKLERVFCASPFLDSS